MAVPPATASTASCEAAKDYSEVIRELTCPVSNTTYDIDPPQLLNCRPGLIFGGHTISLSAIRKILERPIDQQKCPVCGEKITAYQHNESLEKVAKAFFKIEKASRAQPSLLEEYNRKKTLIPSYKVMSFYSSPDYLNLTVQAECMNSEYPGCFCFSHMPRDEKLDICFTFSSLNAAQKFKEKHNSKNSDLITINKTCVNVEFTVNHSLIVDYLSLIKAVTADLIITQKATAKLLIYIEYVRMSPSERPKISEQS